MAFSPYRRAMVAESKKKGGRGWKGNWRDRMKPPKDHATPILLVAGEYRDKTQVDAGTPVMVDQQGRQIEMVLPYYPYEKHVRNLPGGPGGKGRPVDEVCSRGPNPHQPMPCVGCSAQDQGDKSIRLSDAFAFSAVHLIPYHGHPIVDRQTNAYLTKREGPEQGQYLIGYDECEGRNCNFCRVLAGQQAILKQGESFPYWAKDLTTIFGHRRFLDVGKNGLGDVLGWDLSISSTCFGPGYLRYPNGQLVLDQTTQQPIINGICGNQLTTDSWNCSQCANVLIDMSSDPRRDDEIQQLVLQPYPCIHCQRPVDLVEVISCDVCQQARQVNVFSGEVVVWVKRQGEGTGSHMVMEKFESLDTFLAGNVPASLIPPGKSAKDLVTDIAKPYDFEESVLKPKDLAGQAKRLELPIPAQFQHGMQQQFAQPGAYGQPPVANGGPAGAPPQYGPPPTGYPAGYGAPPQHQPPQPQAGQNYQPPPARPNYQQ